MHLTEEQKAPFLNLLVDYGLVKKDQCILELNGKEAEAHEDWLKGKALEDKLACMLEDLDVVGEEENRLFDELEQTKQKLHQIEQAATLAPEARQMLWHCLRVEQQDWQNRKASCSDPDLQAKCEKQLEILGGLLDRFK